MNYKIIVLMTVIAIFSFSISVVAVEGFVEISKNDLIEQLQMKVNVEKEVLFDGFYVGTTMTNYTLESITNKFPVGFVPQSMLFDIYLRKEFGDFELRFNSICQHQFKQKSVNYPKRDYSGVKFSIRYNF